MALLYIYLKRFFLNFIGLSDGKLVSLTKKEHDSAVHFLCIFIEFLNQYLMNDLMRFVEFLVYLEFS